MCSNTRTQGAEPSADPSRHLGGVSVHVKPKFNEEIQADVAQSLQIRRKVPVTDQEEVTEEERSNHKEPRCPAGCSRCMAALLDENLAN